MDEIKESKRRAVNWTERERMVLINEIGQKEEVLFGKFRGCGWSGKAAVCSETKEKVWKEVQESVNAVSVQPRSVDNIKKQYDNIKQRAKSKLDGLKHPKTGGGPPDTPTESQQKYLELHDTRPNVVGLPIIIDTEDPNMLIADADDEGCVPSELKNELPHAVKSSVKKRRRVTVEEDLEVEILQLERTRLLNELELFPIKKAKLEAQRQAAELQVLLLQRQVDAVDLLEILK